LKIEGSGAGRPENILIQIPNTDVDSKKWDERGVKTVSYLDKKLRFESGFAFS
jgi:hypothetical protein